MTSQKKPALFVSQPVTGNTAYGNIFF